MTMGLSRMPGSFSRGLAWTVDCERPGSAFCGELFSGRDCIGILEPAGIQAIVLCDPVDLACNKVYGYVFYLFGGDAAIDGAAFDLGAFEHDGACSDDGVAADLCIVHDDSAHSDEHFITQRAAMYDGVMADGDVVPDDGL